MPDYAGDKTLEPTPHRRQQARREGHVAKSHDLGSAALLLAGLGGADDARRRTGRLSRRLLPQPTGRRAVADGRRRVRRRPMERHALGAGPLPAADPRAALSGRRGGQRAANRLPLPAAAAGLRLHPARSAARAATHLLGGRHGPPRLRHRQAGRSSWPWPASCCTTSARRSSG